MAGRGWFLLILLMLVVRCRSEASELPLPLRGREPSLALLGSSALYWFGIHVYDIALYTEGNPYTTNTTAVLSLRYAIPIKHKRLQETTLQEWRRLELGTPEQRQVWINQLDALWPDIKSGESLSALCQQDGSTVFYFGDRCLGEVTDHSFGPAFFAIWLHENCRYPNVRNRLLHKGANE